MSRIFVCRSCQAQMNRFHAARAPERCIHCQSSDVVELGAQLVASAPVATESSSVAEFACERGETCTRLRGGHCPGGKGC